MDYTKMENMSQQAMYHALYDSYKQSFQAILLSGHFEKLPLPRDKKDDFGSILTLRRIVEKKRQAQPYVMLTINFPKDFDVNLIPEIPLKKWFTRTFIQKAWISFEFHSQDGPFTHPHIHAFIKLKNVCVKKSAIIDGFYKTVTRYFRWTPDQWSKAAIDFKYHDSPDKGKAYIMQTNKKKTETKGLKKDIHLRKKLGLENYYIIDSGKVIEDLRYEQEQKVEDMINGQIQDLL